MVSGLDARERELDTRRTVNSWSSLCNLGAQQTISETLKSLIQQPPALGRAPTQRDCLPPKTRCRPPVRRAKK